ncbi:5'-nucleotidase, lipoprotein e(P4) family [bacterium]|nr:5'-nucleotidase, lipoprotein e(P4) family [bacterium]
MKHLSILIFFAFISCTAVRSQTNTIERSKNAIAVNAMLWHQTSGEYRALCYQAYALAKLRLDEALMNKFEKKPAVIVDIDETVLDNSPYNANLIVTEGSFSQATWKTWTQGANAGAVPGAVEFMNYAVSKGADVFYISNRKIEEKEGTLANLVKMGFPQADDTHVLLKTEPGGKEKRRLKVAETHEIVLLCGDNLNDFTYIFEKKSVTERFDGVEKMKDQWGRKFIILPNPIYGDWEEAIYDYKYGLPDSTRDAKQRAAFRVK